MFQRYLERALPFAHFSAWLELKPFPGCLYFTDPAQTFTSMQKWLAGRTVEFAGIIGPAFFTATAGSPCSAPLSDGIVTWHSHLQDSLLSLDDLLVFLFSSAMATVLFSPQLVAIALKNARALRIREKVRKKVRKSPANPLLTMQKLSRAVSEEIGRSVVDMPEEDIAAFLGIILETDFEE